MFQKQKKPFLAIKNSIFFSSKNHIFPKGLTHAFGQKMYFFFLELFSVKIRLEILFNNALDTKETCFSRKKIQSFKVPKIAFSQRVNPCFWSKMQTETKERSILIFQLKPWINPFGKITSMRLCKMDIFIVWKDFLLIQDINKQ